MKRPVLISFFVLAVLLTAGNLRASVVYTPMNVTASQTSTWNWFSFGPDADGFGLWVNVGASLRLETYQGKVIGTDDGGKVYLTGIPYGTEIGPDSEWITPPAPSYINDATHTGLNGDTVYVAVQLTDGDSKLYYGWMQLMVSADGLSVTLAGMAYQDEAGVSLKAGVIDRQVYYGSTEFKEDLVSNNGAIGSQVTLNLVGVAFSLSTGSFSQGIHFTAANLPEGLTMEIRATDSTHAVVVLNGQATAHAVSDTVGNLSLNFLDAAFTGVPAAEIIGTVTENLVIKFFDPYEIIYEDLEDLVCGVNGWAPFSNDYFGNVFGLWHDGTDHRIETYGQGIVGTAVAGRSYFTPLDEGTIIDESSAWIPTGNWPDEPYLSTGTYTVWNGKHKYAGIQLVVGEAILYGWLNLEVSSDGQTVTLYDWAFNTQPNGPISAGQRATGFRVSEAGTFSMKVFPNPVHSNLSVILNSPLKMTADVEIMDLGGRVIHQEKLIPDGSMKYLVNTGSLNRGIYLIRVSSDEIRFTGKFVRD